MNEPSHYREAEGLLENAGAAELGSPEEQYRLAAAQVHALLALATPRAELTDATEQVHNVLAAYRGQGTRNRLSVELMDALDALRVAVEGK